MSSPLRHLLEAFQRYRAAPLSVIEYSLIQNILKNSRWYALWLTLLFSLATFTLWDHVPTVWLLIFLAVFIVEVLIKMQTSRYFESLPREQQQQAHWRLIFDAGSTYSGLAYGLASLILFHPMPDDNRLLLIGVFCALISNLSAATALFTPISRTMLPCLVTPVTIALLLSGKPLQISLALLMIVSVSCTVFLGRLSQRRYRYLARLNQENKALVENLSEQQKIATEQQIRAEKAVIDKSRFLATASHDLRQPLHALGLFHHALRLKSEDASNRQLFESIDKSTHALNAMFDSLLDVSRLDANVVEPEFETLELALLCSVLEQEFSPIAQEKGLYFCCIPMQARLRTDSTLLARILRNLISNAIKFTEEGGVTIKAQRSSSQLKIVVSDTGPGIPEEERQNVFSEFYQLEGEERFGTVGVGLGLSIVRRLSDLLDIDVHLGVGESGGTVVTLSMACLDPLEAASAENAALASVSSFDTNDELRMTGGDHDLDELHSMQGRCILFIDDDPETCQAMGNTLTGWGCQAICEQDARSALRRLGRQDIMPDLLICDFQLANGESGLDVIRIVREKLARDLPAILVSGASEVEQTRLIQDSGFECLQKPVAVEKLKQVIESMTGKPVCHR